MHSTLRDIKREKCGLKGEQQRAEQRGGAALRRLDGDKAPRAYADGSEKGELLGEHAGIACYTVGQRKGLGLSGGPWFITRIDPKTRVITVSHGSQPHAWSFSLSDVVLWDEPGRGGACLVQTHYRAKARPAHVTIVGSSALVELDEGSTLAADGQSCVLYRNNTVIGGGYIRLQA